MMIIPTSPTAYLELHFDDELNFDKYINIIYGLHSHL